MKNYILISTALLGITTSLHAQNEGFQLGNIKAETVRKHELSPANIRGVKATQDNTIESMKSVDVAVFKEKLKIKPVAKAKPGFDANYFGPLLHEILKDRVVGYLGLVYKDGQPISFLKWNWAKTPADGGKGWNETTRMHVASTSKLMTAMGMVKLLDKKNISLDEKITGYLPTYWQKGNGVDKITFRMLLNHGSGFGLSNNSQSDFTFMKNQVKNGPSDPKYANMNFGLMRILISIIDGRISKTTVFPDDNDKYWDVITTVYYREYMNKNVFAPAGVSNVGFAPNANGAFAYDKLSDPHGWNSGDLASVAGGAAFRMSAEEVLKVVDSFRRKGNIVSDTRAKYMLDNNLGNNSHYDSPAGRIYYRKGAWGTGGQLEQTVVFCLPDNVNIVVFVNSPVGSSDDHISKFARAAIDASIF